MPLFRRLPKRGFHNPFKKCYAIVNVGQLNRFDDGATVDAQVLIDAGMIDRIRDGVKVLGEGDLQKKLTVEAAKFSRNATEKIMGAGGEVKEAK